MRSACRQVCREECVRDSCHSVRRQLLMQLSSATAREFPSGWSGLKFVAVDDSARLDNSTHAGLCCSARNLRSTWGFGGSELAGGVRIRTMQPDTAPGAFVDPSPPASIKLPDVYVNCPMPALAVHAFAAALEEDVVCNRSGYVAGGSPCRMWIVPAGCAMRQSEVDHNWWFLPPTLSEGCQGVGFC